MQVHQLRYFVAAAAEMGISRAAEKLRVSQPALSRQIGLLEEELGVRLFLRSRQRISLTPAGRFFLRKARRILGEMDTAAEQVAAKFGSETPPVRLGFIGPFLDDLIAPAARDFARLHPRTKVSLLDLTPQEQVERLMSGELDIAILGNVSPRDQRRLRAEELMSIPMAAVLPSGHRRAEARSIDLADLSKEDWVSLTDEKFPGRRAFLQETCGQAGFRPKLIRDAETIPLMLADIANGEGVGIAPLHASKIPHEGCVFIPISSPAGTSTQLLLLRKKTPGRPESEALVAILRKRAAAIESKYRTRTP